MFVVVAYDVVSDTRRLKVLACLKNYGARIQKSVFECILPPGQVNVLKGELEALVDGEEDSVRIYVLCDRCREKTIVIGQGDVTKDQELYIV